MARIQNGVKPDVFEYAQRPPLLEFVESRSGFGSQSSSCQLIALAESASELRSHGASVLDLRPTLAWSQKSGSRTAEHVR